MTPKNPTIKQIQIALINKGFSCGKAGADGVYGPNTERAIIAFKLSEGLPPRAYIGPITLTKLFERVTVTGSHQDNVLVPYVNEIGKYLGMHEEDDRLAEWLRSDGGTVGDPDDIPWCGDAIHTAIRNTLPDEPFKGAVKANPYLAKNWCEFGDELDDLAYGAIVSLWRKSPRSMYGHVAIAIGYDPKRHRIRIRGGNQSDRVTDTWVNYNRLRKGGIRAPKTFKSLPPIPIMNSAGAIISTNEA